jgi:uncharacterized protein YlxW (UPF0749 family)
MSIMSEGDGPISMASEGLSGGNMVRLAGAPEQINGAASAARTTEQRLPDWVNSRSASARALAQHIERRRRLADQIRAAHPTYTKAEIEERLEQFGA